MLHSRLYAPDPPEGGGGAAPDPDPEPKPKTAADVAAGKKTAREINLEKKVAVLEDEKKTLADQLAELTGVVEKSRKLPSARKQGKSLWDELNAAISLPFEDAEPPEKV
jgi:hypothetical protein